MKLYRYKNLNMGFAVLCPDRNVGALRSTVSGIRKRYQGAEVCAAVGEDVYPEELEEMNRFCPTTVGQNTITSLINQGLNNSKSDWTLVVMAGSWVRGRLDQKYSYFVEGTKDILFPIVDGRTNFVDGSINGILIHKDGWKAAGQFCNAENPLSICKLLWATDAIESGCHFKAVIGAKII
jgi:hypothetical protein